MNDHKILIIDGPSGVGKDTVINAILTKFPELFERPINATTRPMRENESQNNPYLFLDEETFLKMRESGEIFEQTIRHGTYRGMQKASFEGIMAKGKIPIRDCDKNGLEAIRKQFPDYKLVSVFLMADKAEIERRLIARNEPQESREARLKDYDDYVNQSKFFDYVVYNNRIDDTVNEIMKIIEKA